jgi:hypothetical protein
MFETDNRYSHQHGMRRFVYCDRMGLEIFFHFLCGRFVDAGMEVERKSFTSLFLCSLFNLSFLFSCFASGFRNLICFSPFVGVCILTLVLRSSHDNAKMVEITRDFRLFLGPSSSDDTFLFLVRFPVSFVLPLTSNAIVVFEIKNLRSEIAAELGTNTSRCALQVLYNL